MNRRMVGFLSGLILVFLVACGPVSAGDFSGARPPAAVSPAAAEAPVLLSQMLKNEKSIAPAPPAEAKTVSADAPRIEIADTTLDIGEVIRGRNAEFVFTIKNTGKTDLVIEKAIPSCGCMVARYDPKIPPGGTGKLVATMDTSRFTGPQKKTVVVGTNDPLQPETVLTLKTKVRTLIDIQPRDTLFAQISQGEGFKKELTIATVGEQPLKLSNVTSTNELIRAELTPVKTGTSTPSTPSPGEPATQKKPDYTLLVSIPPDAPIGAVGGTITITTNYKELPEVKIPVYVMIRGEILVTPPSLFLGTLRKADLPLVRRSIGITRKTSDATLKIKKVESTLDGLHLELRTIDEGKSYSIEVTLSGDIPVGRTDGKILIFTNDKFQPTIEVPVQGIIS